MRTNARPILPTFDDSIKLEEEDLEEPNQSAMEVDNSI
jgi:hypothetical protein